MRAVFAGIALGLAGDLTVSRVLGGLLVGVGARDPMTFAATAVLLAAVAVLASAIPAHRASRLDPLVILREE